MPTTFHSSWESLSQIIVVWNGDLKIDVLTAVVLIVVLRMKR
jgi:hypothetical protein